MPTSKGPIVGIDLGARRIGVAVSDGLGLCANPLLTLPSRGDDEDSAVLAGIAREHEAAAFVIGLPLNMDGTEGPACARARAFAAVLERAAGLPVRFWDERLSTVEAEELLKAAGRRGARKKRLVDQAAAVVILQGYLDAHAGGA